MSTSISLWDEIAPEQHEHHLRVTHALARTASLEPYLMAATSATDFDNRVGLNEAVIHEAAQAEGVTDEDIVEHYRKRAALLIEAQESKRPHKTAALPGGGAEDHEIESWVNPSAWDDPEAAQRVINRIRETSRHGSEDDWRRIAEEEDARNEHTSARRVVGTAYSRDNGTKDGKKYGGGVKFAGDDTHSRAYSSSGNMVGFVAPLSGDPADGHTWNHYSGEGSSIRQSGTTATAEEARHQLSEAHNQYVSDNRSKAQELAQRMSAEKPDSISFRADQKRNWTTIKSYPVGNEGFGGQVAVYVNHDTGQVHPPTKFGQFDRYTAPSSKTHGHIDTILPIYGGNEHTSARKTVASNGNGWKTDDNGQKYLGCCTSTIGPKCQHRVGMDNNPLVINGKTIIDNRRDPAKTAARSRVGEPSYGTMAACKNCDQDIQYVGHDDAAHKQLGLSTGAGWFDRGGNYHCDSGDPHVPYVSGGVTAARKQQSGFVGFDRRMASIRQALIEGQDPLQWVVEETEARANNVGPEKPSMHNSEGDYSNGYSEIPAGPTSQPNISGEGYLAGGNINRGKDVSVQASKRRGGFFGPKA